LSHHLRLSLTPPSPPAPHTLSLHDALPICLESPTVSTCMTGPLEGLPLDQRAALLPHELGGVVRSAGGLARRTAPLPTSEGVDPDRKSTRLNSSHLGISYAVFCLKKKKQHS